jgi:hypothetical protein
MNIKQLKELIKDLPDDMPVGLWDITTDDFTDLNYSLTKESFMVEDYVEEENGDIKGQMLFICFENKLNENPI